MTGWIFGLLLAAAIAALCWRTRRATERHWQHLERVLDDLSAGREPESYVFQDKGHFAQLTYRLERLAEELGRMRQQIAREQSNVETVLASMEEGVMVVDAHHILRQINPSFLKLFELKQDPRGLTILQVLREPEVEAMIGAALKTGEAQTRDIVTNGGRPARHFAIHAVPMRDDEGRPGVVTIFRDTSRLKQLEDVRREFVANVSHELRTPLSIFHGYVENLLDQPDLEHAEQMEIFGVLRKHSLRLNALLEDLLTLARLESRHDQLQREPILPAEFLRGLAAEWEARAKKKKIQFTLEIPGDLPVLEADPLRLEQVVNNLLENAVKYTLEGGCVTLRAEVIGDALDVRIADSGIGIPPPDLPHIFERFYRADKARTREQGGTGLGLSIVKHIVQTHGGTVQAESTYGKGTTIAFRLPLTAPVPAPDSD